MASPRRAIPRPSKRSKPKSIDPGKVSIGEIPGLLRRLELKAAAWIASGIATVVFGLVAVSYDAGEQSGREDVQCERVVAASEVVPPAPDNERLASPPSSAPTSPAPAKPKRKKRVRAASNDSAARAIAAGVARLGSARPGSLEWAANDPNSPLRVRPRRK